MILLSCDPVVVVIRGILVRYLMYRRCSLAIQFAFPFLLLLSPSSFGASKIHLSFFRPVVPFVLTCCSWHACTALSFCRNCLLRGCGLLGNLEEHNKNGFGGWFLFSSEFHLYWMEFSDCKMIIGNSTAFSLRQFKFIIYLFLSHPQNSETQRVKSWKIREFCHQHSTPLINRFLVAFHRINHFNAVVLELTSEIVYLD